MVGEIRATQKTSNKDDFFRFQNSSKINQEEKNNEETIKGGE
jgi:hypothetical protein